MPNYPALVYLWPLYVHMIVNIGWVTFSEGASSDADCHDCCGRLFYLGSGLVVLDEAGHNIHGLMRSDASVEFRNRKMIIEDDIDMISKRGSNCRRWLSQIMNSHYQQSIDEAMTCSLRKVRSAQYLDAKSRSSSKLQTWILPHHPTPFAQPHLVPSSSVDCSHNHINDVKSLKTEEAKHQKRITIYRDVSIVRFTSRTPRPRRSIV